MALHMFPTTFIFKLRKHDLLGKGFQITKTCLINLPSESMQRLILIIIHHNIDTAFPRK